VSSLPLEIIKVSNFKSIRELNLELNNLNILIGANGAGKSNFINIFKFLNNLVNKNLQVYVKQSGGADQILHFGRKNSNELDIELWFESNNKKSNGYKCSLIPTNDDTLIFLEEKAYFHNRNLYQNPYETNLGSGHTESRLADYITTPVVNYVFSDIKSWRIYHFHDTSDSAKVKQTGPINDNMYLKPDASNLAAFLYYLKEARESYYKNIIEVIRLAAPFFDDFILRPNPLNPETIRLEWKEKGSDTYFNAHTLSDGTLRFICLATLFLQPEDHFPSSILLDEPELGLHPFAITLLVNLILSASHNVQVIVSTQSVTLVNQFSPEDIIVVDRDNGESVFRRLPPEEIEKWTDDYGLGDLWEKNIIGGRPSQ